MGVIKANSSDIKLLARLMRAEAVGDGRLAMLLVGNVAVNRVRVDCSDFKKINNIREMVYQPHGFSATLYGFFYQKARDKEKRLARRAVKGERHWPAKYSLWYFRPPGDCPSTWYNQPKSGRYKAHCFYEPTGKTCTQVYTTY